MTSGTATQWTLDPRLAAETLVVGDLPLSRVLLNDDANFPWLILAPRRPATTELIDLAAPERAQLMDEIARASTALRNLTRCDKLNVAALGNVVAQLHVHVIARFHDDAAWPAPVWGKAARRAYARADRDSLAARLREALQIAPSDL